MPRPEPLLAEQQRIAIQRVALIAEIVDLETRLGGDPKPELARAFVEGLTIGFLRLLGEHEFADAVVQAAETYWLPGAATILDGPAADFASDAGVLVAIVFDRSGE